MAMTVGSASGTLTMWPARALEKAGRSGRIDDGKEGALVAEPDGEMAGNGRCNAADAGLHEDMARRLRQIAQRFRHQSGVTLHDEAGNSLVTRP